MTPSSMRTLVAWLVGAAAIAVLFLSSGSPGAGYGGSAQPPFIDQEPVAVESTATVPEAEPATETVEPPALLLPVFVYHHVHPTQNNYLTITPAVFESHLAELARLGYQGITTAQLADYFTHGTELPDNPVLITFDDAWSNQYNHALPLLEQYGYPATFFAYRSVIGGSPFMSTAQLQDLVARGFEVQSHSLVHDSLSGRAAVIDDAAGVAISRELVDSGAWASSLSGTPQIAFAYPYGHYDELVAQMVGQAGYSLAFTVDEGQNDLRECDPLLLKRFTIFRGTSAAELVALLGSRPLGVREAGPTHAAAGQVALRCVIDVDEGLDTSTASFVVDLDQIPTLATRDAETLILETSVSLDTGFHYVTVLARFNDGSRGYGSWGVVAGP